MVSEIRVCPNKSCQSLGKFQQGDTLIADGITRGGDFKGNNLWYSTNYNGQTAYVNTALVIESELVSHPQSTQPVVSVPGQPPVQSVISQPPFVPICSGNVYNCDDLTCPQIAIYAATCPGDPSNLAGNDHDGKYCEDKCS